MGNRYSSAHQSPKPRKNVHWKSAGRPGVPGIPVAVSLTINNEPNAIKLTWTAPSDYTGAPLQGYQVQCKKLDSQEWTNTTPLVIDRPELVLLGLEPQQQYQFRVAALNSVGLSDYSETSDIITVDSKIVTETVPKFLIHLKDLTVLENDKTEFRVSFTGSPTPMVAWYKDDYEIFSSRRTAISTDERSSVLLFHQTLSSDKGMIRCTITNRNGYATTSARLVLESIPKLRYPRQYEDGLIYEVNEIIFLRTTLVGNPPPTVEWRHNGNLVISNDRVNINNTSQFSILEIRSAQRSDRGEYQVSARNPLGEDSASFLVTITSSPEPPQNVCVTRQIDKSVSLNWEPPYDDGGCRIVSYVVEYYRAGWDVWLKATTSRKTNVILFELIEGSEYKFRVKAESPYGISEPSEESASIHIPICTKDLNYSALETYNNNKMLDSQDEDNKYSVPYAVKSIVSSAVPWITQSTVQTFNKEFTQCSEELSTSQYATSNSAGMEFNIPEKTPIEVEKWDRSLQDSISQTPISISMPELRSQYVQPFQILRCSVSSTELLHEYAKARFYRVLEKIKNESENNNVIQTQRKSLNQQEFNTHEDPRAHENFVRNEIKNMKLSTFNDRDIAKKPIELPNKYLETSKVEYSIAGTISINESNGKRGLIENKSRYFFDTKTNNPFGKCNNNITSFPFFPLQNDKIIREYLMPLFPNPNTILKDIKIVSTQAKNNKQMNIKAKITKKRKMLKESVIEKDQISVSRHNNNIYKSIDILNSERLALTNSSKKVNKSEPLQNFHEPMVNKLPLKSVLKKQIVVSKNNNNMTNHLAKNTSDAPKNLSFAESKLFGKVKMNEKVCVNENVDNELNTSPSQVILSNTKKMMRFIPVNYENIEKKAKLSVKSAMDQTVNICLLLITFWVYFFKDVRLVIPLLMLIVYRQMRKLITVYIP